MRKRPCRTQRARPTGATASPRGGRICNCPANGLGKASMPRSLYLRWTLTASRGRNFRRPCLPRTKPQWKTRSAQPEDRSTTLPTRRLRTEPVARPHALPLPGSVRMTPDDQPRYASARRFSSQPDTLLRCCGQEADRRQLSVEISRADLDDADAAFGCLAYHSSVDPFPVRVVSLQQSMSSDRSQRARRGPKIDRRACRRTACALSSTEAARNARDETPGSKAAPSHSRRRRRRLTRW